MDIDAAAGNDPRKEARLPHALAEEPTAERCVTLARGTQARQARHNQTDAATCQAALLRMNCTLEDVQQAAMDIAKDTGEVCVVYALGDSWAAGLSYMVRTMDRVMEVGAPEDSKELGRAWVCVNGAFWSVLH
jgi:hypothetical protein